jgi:hypothetical protein
LWIRLTLSNCLLQDLRKSINWRWFNNRGTDLLTCCTLEILLFFQKPRKHLEISLHCTTHTAMNRLSTFFYHF